jgi:hypothetical protein
MSDLRDALDRESERYDLAPGALERTLDRQRRRSQRRRIGTVVVGLAIAGITVLLAVSLGGLGRQPSRPASPASLIQGTWRSGRLSEQDVVRAFVAAAGSAKIGRAFFAQLGDGATRYAVITLRFEDGSFVEFESGDGGPPVAGYEATYKVSKAGILTISSRTCTGTYSFSVVEDRQLRLNVIHQCSADDAPFNTTLFASFPLTKQG